MSARWKKNRQRIIQIAGTILAVLLLVILLRDVSWDEIVSVVGNIQPINLLWVAILFFISRMATVSRWHVLLRSGGVDIRFRDSAALTFTGLFASNFLPSTIGGDLVRLAGAMQMGFDRAVCFASIAADRLIGMLGMGMTLPIGLYYSWGFLAANASTLFSMTFFQRTAGFIKRTLSAFVIWFKKPYSLLGSLGCTWIHMLCLFSSIYIIIADLGNPVSFWMIAGLWSLTYFITQIPISVNGYGVQELVFTFFMSKVAGVPPAVGLSTAVILRAYFVASSLPGAYYMPSIVSAMAGQKQVSPSNEDLL